MDFSLFSGDFGWFVFTWFVGGVAGGWLVVGLGCCGGC